uniref:Exopolysaccharide biosynthesis polyprenyl glycosylphosphotransferase n=1 Tax=candidate division WOR-3 bacterium TaxID=2052148 RepID=A0A7V0Z7L2_UNCW3
MIKAILLFTDILVIVSSFLVGKFLRYHNGAHFIPNQITTFLFLVLVIPLISYLYDLYNHYYYAQSGRVFFKLVNVWILSFIGYVIVGFLTKFYFLNNSRGFIFYFFFISYPLITSFFRLLIIPRILRSYFSKPDHRTVCKYIGPEDKFVEFNQFFKENPIIGFNLTNSNADENKSKISEIFLFSAEKDFGGLYEELKQYSSIGKKVHIVTGLFNDLPLRWEWCKIDNLPIISLKINGEKRWQAIVRRILDILLSSLFLIILLPFFAIIALAIKLDSSGPVIYKQKRCGRNGKEFTLYKFRSMYNNNTQEKRENCFKAFIENKTPKGKIIDYDEITKVGRILRRTSLDEIPQFFNVLKGDMTLIGPRPPIPYEVKYYKEWHKDRLKVKPGVSGLWQVYGRGIMPCDSSIFLDLLYTMNRSITLDLKLLFQTIPAVLLGKGAY